MEQQLLTKTYGLRITKIILQVISGTLVMLFVSRSYSFLFRNFLMDYVTFNLIMGIIINLGSILLVAFIVYLIGQGYWHLKPYLSSLFGTIIGLIVYVLFLYVLGTLGLVPS